jgi:hypothetical protein
MLTVYQSFVARFGKHFTTVDTGRQSIAADGYMAYCSVK